MTTDAELFGSVWAGRAALALIIVMFVTTIGYMIWVMILDVREEREQRRWYDDIDIDFLP